MDRYEFLGIIGSIGIIATVIDGAYNLGSDYEIICTLIASCTAVLFSQIGRKK